MQGELVPDPKTFPSGIKALADYIHGKGLKIGIYSDAGWDIKKSYSFRLITNFLNFLKLNSEEILL